MAQPAPIPIPWGAGVRRPKAQGARILKAGPLGKTVWARRTERAGGRVQESQQGHLELALGKHFHHGRVKMIPVSV